MAQLLSQTEIDTAMPHLRGWAQCGKKLQKDYCLADFQQALEFVNAVGEKAEAVDQHPDLWIHENNKVKVSLFSHALGGLTDFDVRFAREIETVASARS